MIQNYSNNRKFIIDFLTYIVMPTKTLQNYKLRFHGITITVQNYILRFYLYVEKQKKTCARRLSFLGCRGELGINTLRRKLY